MRLFGTFLAAALFSTMMAGPAWTAQDQENVTVNVNIPPKTELDFELDSLGGSGATDPFVIEFFTVDADDPGVTGPSPDFMYAPVRSVADTGKNWHLARINTNEDNVTLSAQVSGTMSDGTNLADIMSTWCGGFFSDNGPAGVDKYGWGTGVVVGDWEPLNTFSRTLGAPDAGVSSFNYRLSIAGVAAGVSTGGNVLWTLQGAP